MARGPTRLVRFWTKQEADADAADAKEAPEGGKKKKKKKPAAGVTLSFDADEEG